MRTLIALSALMVLASTTTAHAGWIEGAYGHSNTSNEAINDYRSGFKWNGTTATSGELKDADYTGLSIGGHFLFHTRLSFRFDSMTSKLAPTSIPSTSYSVSDSFVYQPLFAMIELPLRFGGGFMFTLGAGYGYALNFQFHQKQTGGNNEDVVWQAHPTALRARASLGYNFTHHFGIFGEAYYDSVKSTLSAAKDYQTTVDGSAIAAGQHLTDSATGKAVTADLSGMRYGLGIRLMF